MAEFARTVKPSLATNEPCDAHRVGPFDIKGTGEVIKPGPCYVKSDGSVWQSQGTATSTDASNAVDGWAIHDYPNVGGPITLYEDIDMAWGPANATPGTKLFLSTSKGELDTSASYTNAPSIAKVMYTCPNEGKPSASIRCRSAW